MSELTAEQKSFLDSIPDAPSSSLTKEQSAFLDSIPTTAPSAPASMGDMRSREGAGQIAASQYVNPATTRATPMPTMGGEMAFAPNYLRRQIEESPQQTELLRREAGQVGPEAAKMVGLTAGLVTAPMSGPATLGGLIVSGIGSGAAQAAAEEAARQLLGTEKFSGKKFFEETGKGAGLGAIGGAVARVAPPVIAAGAELVPAAFAAGKAAVRGQPWVSPLKDASRRAVATLIPTLRPSGLRPPTASQLDFNDTSAIIKHATGEDLPVQMSDVMRAPGFAEKVTFGAKEGAEWSDVDRESFKRVIAMAAAGLKGKGMAPIDLANEAVAILQKEVGLVNDATKKAVGEVAAAMSPSLEKAFKEVSNAARKAVPGTVSTPTELGNSVKEITDAGLQESKAGVKQAYDEAKSVIPPENTTATITRLKGEGEDIMNSVFHEKKQVPNPEYDASDPLSSALIPDMIEEYKPLPSLLPGQVSASVKGVARADETQTLARLLQFRTILGESTRNKGILPGLPDYMKEKLYKAATEDLEATFMAIGGPGGEKWREAWKAMKAHGDTFSGSKVENVILAAGRDEGQMPASIVSMFEGKDAPTIIDQLKAAAGSRSKEIDRVASEYLFNQAADAGKSGAEFSIGKMLKKIQDYAPEMQKSYFPNLSQIEALAKRESLLAGLKGKGDDLINALKTEDPTVLMQALGPAADAKVKAKLKDALSAMAKQQSEFNGSVIGQIAKADGEGISATVDKNPLRFVQSITDGTFSPAQTRKALDLVAKENPELMSDLQFHFVDNLLNTYQSSRGMNFARLAQDIGAGTTTRAQTPLREQALAVIGPQKLEGLRSVLESWGKVEANGGAITGNSALIDLTARGAGGIISATALAGVVGPVSAGYQLQWLTRAAPNIKYALASYLLTNQELRKFAMTPISQVSRQQVKVLIDGFRTYYLSKLPEGSPEAEDLNKSVNEVLNK